MAANEFGRALHQALVFASDLSGLADHTAHSRAWWPKRYTNVSSRLLSDQNDNRLTPQIKQPLLPSLGLETPISMMSLFTYSIDTTTFHTGAVTTTTTVVTRRTPRATATTPIITGTATTAATATTNSTVLPGRQHTVQSCAREATM